MDMLILAAGTALTIVAFLLGSYNTCNNGHRGITKKEAELMLKSAEHHYKSIKEGKVVPTYFFNIKSLEEKIETLRSYIKEFDSEEDGVV